MYFIEFYKDDLDYTISGRAIFTNEEFEKFLEIIRAVRDKIDLDNAFYLFSNNGHTIKFTNGQAFYRCFTGQPIEDEEAMVLKQFIFRDKIEYGDTYWEDGTFPYEQMIEFIE